MIFKLNPIENEALLFYRGSLITNPVNNAEPTDWDTFNFFHNHLQEEGGFIEVDFTSKDLSRPCVHENLVWFPPKLHNTAI